MKRWAAVLALGVVTAMSGCGAGQGGAPAGNSGGSGSANSVDPTADTGTPAPPPGPSGAPIVEGTVSVTLDAGGYAVGRTIRVSVHNGMDRPVYTEDVKTACSIVILQRKNDDAWADVTGCALGRPTATVTLEPGLSEPIDLDPNSFHLTTGGTGPAFGAGTYRVRFTYRVEPVSTGPDPLSVFSAEFSVR